MLGLHALIGDLIQCRHRTVILRRHRVTIGRRGRDRLTAQRNSGGASGKTGLVLTTGATQRRSSRAAAPAASRSAGICIARGIVGPLVVPLATPILATTTVRMAAAEQTACHPLDAADRGAMAADADDRVQACSTRWEDGRFAYGQPAHQYLYSVGEIYCLRTVNEGSSMTDVSRTPHQIAIIDDDTSTRQLLFDLLVDESYQVALWSAAEDPVRFVRDAEPDLVILDLHLGSGYQAWDVIDALCGDGSVVTVPVIICSADGISLGRDQHRYHEHGCVVLAKPFDLDDLLHAIREQLDSHHVGDARQDAGDQATVSG